MRFLNILSAAKCVGVNRHLEENKSAIKIIRRQDKHKKYVTFPCFKFISFSLNEVQIMTKKSKFLILSSEVVELDDAIVFKT